MSGGRGGRGRGRGASGGRGRGRGRGRGSPKNGEASEDVNVEEEQQAEEPSGQGTGVLKCVDDGAAGEVQKPGEDGKVTRGGKGGRGRGGRRGRVQNDELTEDVNVEDQQAEEPSGQGTDGQQSVDEGGEGAGEVQRTEETVKAVRDGRGVGGRPNNDEVTEDVNVEEQQGEGPRDQDTDGPKSDVEGGGVQKPAEAGKALRRGRGGRQQIGEESEDVNVEEPSPRDQDTGGTKSVEGGEVLKRVEAGKAVLDGTGEDDDVNMDETEDSSDEDEDSDLEGEDDEEWLPRASANAKRRRKEEDEDRDEENDDEETGRGKGRGGRGSRGRGESRGRGRGRGKGGGRGRGRGRGRQNIGEVSEDINVQEHQAEGPKKDQPEEAGKVTRGERGGRGRGRGRGGGRGRQKIGEVSEDVNVQEHQAEGPKKDQPEEAGRGGRGRGRGRGRGGGRARLKNGEVSEDVNVEEEHQAEGLRDQDTGGPKSVDEGTAGEFQKPEEAGKAMRGGRGGRGRGRGGGRARLKNGEVSEDVNVEDEQQQAEGPRDTDGLKRVGDEGGGGGEGQKPGEAGKAVLDDTGEEAPNVNESKDSRGEDENPDLEGGGDDDVDRVPSREEAEGEEEEEEEEAAAGSSTSKGKAAVQPRGSAASGGRGRGRGKGQDPAALPTGADVEGGPWLDDSTEDHLPPQPEFQPLRTPGPQITQGAEYTTMQLFRLFFTDTMLRTLVRNTNKYGASCHADRWTDLTRSDVFSYMSLLIYMGMTQLPATSDYWRQAELYNLSFPRSVMSRRKFKVINTALYMSDPDDDAVNDARKGTAEYDCLHKLKPLYTELREACKTNFHPYQHIRVDERKVITRPGLVQKDKQSKYGYKWFVLMDSRSGYTWDFHMNEGRCEMERGKGLSYDLVMELLSTKALGAGYKLYVDNFYNSPEFFKDLLQQKVWACGTVGPSNTKGFPRTDRPGALDKKSPRGASRWIREEPLLFVQWRDTRIVQVCSTMHQAHAGETVQRKVKVAGGKWSTKDIPVPPAVKDYYKHMGGADLSHALIDSYKVPSKSRKWHQGLFSLFLDIAIVNAFVLHKEIALSKGQTPKTQKAFREELAMELSKARSRTTYTFATPPPAPHLIRGVHLPVYIGGNATQSRKLCCLCRKKTPIMCEACARPFCMVSARNCYTHWHTQNIPVTTPGDLKIVGCFFRGLEDSIFEIGYS
ncbi:uncharacterized protein LOC134464766 [Engraulis encrasicolus]|uniref:uncharacterized protein LOC134464766 n=1 Tax=Engraulis encrasicolus TaxID=184585 RepID=UPI002FD0BFAF